MFVPESSARQWGEAEAHVVLHARTRLGSHDLSARHGAESGTIRDEPSEEAVYVKDGAWVRGITRRYVHLR